MLKPANLAPAELACQPSALLPEDFQLARLERARRKLERDVRLLRSYSAPAASSAVTSRPASPAAIPNQLENEPRGMTPTVDQVLDEAIRRIDEAFGVGSAEDNRQCYPARQRGGFNKFELTRERDAAVPCMLCRARG